MKIQINILIVLVLFSILSGNLSGQIGIGSPQKAVAPAKSFEHIACGFRFPLPGEFTQATSIGYSAYQKLGEGMINRFTSDLVTYDIGCIDLDDPPRKMKKDVLVSSLNSLTKNYLEESFTYVSLPKNIADDREIYEFKTKTNPPRYIKYILKGNQVLIFSVRANEEKGIKKALKLFDSVEFFSVREAVEQRMETATRKLLPQSPSLKATQTDAALDKLKGTVKSVRIEAEDVPILVGKQERRLRSDETYDRSGNLLKSYWFQDSGYPTSVKIYGFIEGARVSDSEEIDYDTTLTLTAMSQGNVELPPADERYEARYTYKYDKSKRLAERKEYDNHGQLNGTYTFTYKADLMEEKWFGADGKLNSTKRRQFDKNGNEIKYEFWWYDETDKEIENYTYKNFDKLGNWTERQVVKTIIDRGLTRTRTSREFRIIKYHEK